MGLTFKTFANLVQDGAAAVQTKASKLISLDKGSLLLAFLQACSAQSLWLQGEIIYLLSTTRLKTTQGNDTDTWVNDWGVYRLQATLSNGSVTYGRFTPVGDVSIPVGSVVKTADLSQSFVVVADATNSSYDSNSNSYLMPDQVASVVVPVVSQNGSVTGNVLAGTVTVMYDAIVGVDYVSNDANFVGGSDAESDDELKARFIQYIQSLSKGTISAIEYAVSALQLGLSCSIIENQSPDGTSMPGFLWVTVDDGSGAPSSIILTEAGNAVGSTRAAGIMWGVFSPQVLQANIGILLQTASGYDHNTIVAQVSLAVQQYVNTLPLGQGLPYLKLAQVIWNSAVGITGVSLYLNNSALDIVAQKQNVVKISQLTVT